MQKLLFCIVLDVFMPSWPDHTWTSFIPGLFSLVLPHITVFFSSYSWNIIQFSPTWGCWWLALQLFFNSWAHHSNHMPTVNQELWTKIIYTRFTHDPLWGGRGTNGGNRPVCWCHLKFQKTPQKKNRVSKCLKPLKIFQYFFFHGAASSWLYIVCHLVISRKCWDPHMMPFRNLEMFLASSYKQLLSMKWTGTNMNSTFVSIFHWIWVFKCFCISEDSLLSLIFDMKCMSIGN